MVKTIKSPTHDGGPLGWQDQQPQQLQQQQQQQQYQQHPQQHQMHFQIQQQVQPPMRQQQANQLPTFQQSFQQGGEPINQIPSHQSYSSGMPIGNAQASFKKETGSKALWAPPTADSSYNLTPPAYYNYGKVQGIGNDTTVPHGLGTINQFPQKDNYRGNYSFQLIFLNDSSKLVVTPSSEPKGNAHMNTTNGSMFTAFIAHTLGPSAVVRVFLVYSNDAESTTPVHPCKNHQVEHHPNHMLTVSGTGDSKYEEHHHPSILVTPTPTSEIVNGNPSCLKYCVQVEFHCRNSCLNRKDLTLVCQLEESGMVYGRECLEVKVSACPRRDAKVKDKKKVTETLSDNKDMLSLPSPRPMKRTANEAFAPKSADILSPSDDLERFAYFRYMEKQFQQMFPEQHTEAKRQFQGWWAARWNNIEDN